MSKAKQAQRISVKLQLVEWEMLRKLAACNDRKPQGEFRRLVRAACRKAGVQLTAHELRSLERRANRRA